MNWNITHNRNEATHMVVGNKKGEYFGLIALTTNEFFAHRIKREVIKDGGTAKVVPFDKANYDKLEDVIAESFFNKAR